MLPTSGFTVGERLIHARPPRKELRKISVSLLLTTLMIATPASAFVSSWVGPNTASGTSQSIAGGFQVPGNSTVLDAWLNVGEDGMPSVGNGTGWHSADLPGNMSVGQFNGSTMTHFDETLSLQPNGSFSNIDHFSNSSYYFPMGWTETGGVWGVDGLTGITGNVVNGKRILAHGEIPPSPHGGGISAATSAGTALAAGTNAILTSPTGMTIPSPVLNYSIGFWHWYHLDTPSNTNGNADGAWVEIKLDNGNWTWIEPVGGYGNTISPTVTVPNGAQANGSNGFPAFASVNSSGWQFANFSLDNVSGINTATSIQMRLRVMTMANATARPGWFIDDIEIFNQGNSTGVWHHGCYVATGTCSYSADAEGILEFPTIDLSNAQSNATVSFLADWDIEGYSYDNWWLEASDDNQTWIDITTPNTNYTLGGWVQPDGIPVQGLIVNGNTYTQDSGGFVAMNFPLPSSFIGDNTTWIRFRVVTDGIVDYGATQDNLEGLIIDNLRVHENNATYFLEDYFNSSSTVSHYALNSSSNGSTDDWTYRSLGMGYFSNNYGFEDSPALPPGGWQVQNATGNIGWEFGTSIGAGPTNWPSSPAGFGTVVGGSYDSNSWEHLFSPHYTIPAGASASLTFTHWICAESNWDGGAVYISVNNGTWTHFDNTYQNGSSWYDGTITSHTTSPLYNMKVFDGSSRVAAGGWSCNGGGNSIPWVTETADLTNYSGMDVQFRFSFTSDGSVQYEGWYIDDIGVEVDYFDDSGDWTSPAVQPDEHGWGFVDVEAIIPEDTWVTATITDSGNQVIPGYENRTIPVDLAALSPLAYSSGIHVKLNLGTDDPFLTPLVSHLQVGSMRFFEPISANNTGWIVPANSGMELNATGYFVNTQGVVNTVEAPFVNSGIPIDGVAIDGNFQGVTITLGSQYNSVMGITNTGSYFLPDVSPGFEVSLDIQPNGWIEWMSFSGNMIAPALNGEVDVTNDGTIDWSFPADPNYGAFGFQDRIAGDNLSNTVDTRSQTLSIGSQTNPISSTTVLLPANANLVAAGLSLYSSAGENLSLSVAGSQVTTITGPWTGVMNVHLSAVDVSAIHSLAGTHSDTTGRLWSEISIALSGDDQVVELSGIKFGYELSENVTNLGQQVKNFHELNNQNGLANSVNIPLEWTADRGGISLGGGVEHELMITNEPFSAPTTFHPTGYNQGFTTGHHHLFDNSEISTVVLTGQASADDIIVTVSDLSTGGTFTQTSGSNMLSIDENSSSVQLVSGSWIVDWQFVVPWSWDDEAQVNWSAQAFNHTGEGLAPATAVSGGSGSQASENDLEIDGFVVRDEFNRLLSNEWDPSYPFYAASQTLVHVSGSVRFQNTPDVRPLVDDFLVSVNVSGTETFINSTDTGEWAGTVSLPNGSGIANISASIVRAGPITGAVGAQDVTTLRSPFLIQLDSNAPSLVALELDTPQGLKPADGFTWDPDLPLAVSATVHDSEALGDNVSLYFWREFIDDANTDGHPDSEEYWSVSVDLPAGTVGERQVSFPLIDLTQTITNGNVSLYISGTDWSGHQYADGGMSGYDTDAATLVTAANTATTFSLDSLTLDRVDEYLLAGQTHTLSFALADGNGIHTLDRIDVYLQGQAHTTPSMITIDPRSSTISSASDYITVSEMRITDIGSSSSRFDIDFIIAWDAPDDWDSQWAIPEILVFDDDLVNPTLSIPNLGQIRWILDRDLALVIDDVIDITPPQGISTDDAMYVASGDAVNIFGNLTFAATGHTISELPEGMSAKVYLEYDFQEVSDTVLLSEDGSFSAGIILPSRTISNPVLALNLELFGMPSPAEDLTSQTYTIIVDSEQPTVRFSALASTIDSLILPEYLLTVTLEDDAGIPDQNITVNWEYRRDGSLVMGSQGQVNVSSVASQGETASFSDIVNLDTNDDLKVGDVLLIWVEGHDYAGNAVTGAGTDSDPIAVEVMVREFIITVPSISIGDSNGKPFTGNQATTGTEIAFTVSLRNSGNLAGVVNVSLTESFDDGTWLEHQTIEVTLPESGTRTLEALIFEAYQDGAQRLYVNISGDIDNFTPMISTPGCALVADGLVQCSLSEEVDMPTVISAESVEDESTPLFMVIVAVILSLILFLAVLFYRKNQVDEYAYEEDWEDHTGHVVADMYVESKQTPEIPTADISADAQTLEPQEANIEPVVSEMAVDESQNAEEIVVEENISDASSDDVEQDADDTEPSDAVELSDSIESAEEPEPVEWGAEW